MSIEDFFDSREEKERDRQIRLKVDLQLEISKAIDKFENEWDNIAEAQDNNKELLDTPEFMSVNKNLKLNLDSINLDIKRKDIESKLKTLEQFKDRIEKSSFKLSDIDEFANEVRKYLGEQGSDKDA